MNVILPDHFVGGPLSLADHAAGSAVVAMPDGVMRITMSPPTPLPAPTWTLSGGIWNDIAPWNDAALWEDN